MTQDLNTPICFLVKTGEEVESSLKRLPGDKASIRTYQLAVETKSKTPFHPNIPKAEVSALAFKYLNEGRVEVMISEGVPEEDSEISAISIVRAEDIYTEYAEGPGTVRRISMGEVVPKTITYSKYSGIPIDERIEKVMHILGRLHCMDIMFEWSWSKKLVGWKKQPYIFWEFMNNGPNAYFEGWNRK